MATIYVYLPDELVHVWRPVLARRLREGIYRISKQRYDRNSERWEFEPGDVVFCQPRVSGRGERILVAVRLATEEEGG